MYDFYPEWGPARHRQPQGFEPTPQPLSRDDRRDDEGERPDDN